MQKGCNQKTLIIGHLSETGKCFFVLYMRYFLLKKYQLFNRRKSFFEFILLNENCMIY